MIRTAYHAKYVAYKLTRRHSADNLEKLAGTLVDAQVDLNPHQVDAALFAFHSPLSKGAILADEVGLSKTIEAGLVISQRWAECKRRILVITPSNLRKQWLQELQEKFFLPCRIPKQNPTIKAARGANLTPLMGLKSSSVLTQDNWIRNQVGAHFNPHVASISESMVKQFGANVVTLADSLLCPHCHKLPCKNNSGSYWECVGCGKMRLYPLAAPGQDPKGIENL